MNQNDNPENISQWLKNLRRLERKSLETLRGWSMTFLYFSLALWSVVLVYALIKFDILTMDGGVMPWIALLGCMATFASSQHTGRKFLKAMRKKKSVPATELTPFFCIAITIVIMGRGLAAA